MKKISIIAALAAATLMLVSSCGAQKAATGSTTYQTTTSSGPIYKGTEGKVREWQNEGFKPSGSNSTFTMYDMLQMHNDKILSDPDRYISVFGTGQAKDKASARYAALNNAATTYATQAGSVISGGMSRQFSDMSEDVTKLMGAYTQKVQQYIMPYLKESVAVFKTENDIQTGKPEILFEVYYLLDEEKAMSVRKQAIDESLQETATEQVFGTAVDEWVKTFVTPEE